MTYYLLLVFVSAVVLIRNNFLYHQIKAFEQYHLKQTKFHLSKRLNYHPHGTSGPWLSTCTPKPRAYNPVFTRYACSIVISYENLQSIPAEDSLMLLKSIFRWHNFILLKTNVCRKKLFQKIIYFRKKILLALIFPTPIFHSLLALQSFQLFSKALLGLLLISFFLTFLTYFRFHLLRWSHVLGVP